MFRRIFERRGGHVGQYPVLNFQYRIVAHIRSLVGRLAIQNRSFEAGGLDAIAYGIEQARREGDEELVELFEAQRADEIVARALRQRVDQRGDPAEPAHACWRSASRSPARRRRFIRSWARKAPRA